MIRDNTRDDCPSWDYAPGVPDGTCESDGHYLCKNCIHMDADLIEADIKTNAKRFIQENGIHQWLNIRQQLRRKYGNKIKFPHLTYRQLEQQVFVWGK